METRLPFITDGIVIFAITVLIGFSRNFRSFSKGIQNANQQKQAGWRDKPRPRHACQYDHPSRRSAYAQWSGSK